MSDGALALITGLVVTVTGFQLYKDANELYFSFDCRRCDGTGLLTCNKCRGYGYMKKGPDDNVRAFRQSEDVSNIYLCPFCNGGGTAQCTGCRGAAKLWPSQVNLPRLFKWRHVHQGAAERHYVAARTAVDARKDEARRKISSGQGGFKMGGSANFLPPEGRE